jgi:hypothetical protein
MIISAKIIKNPRVARECRHCGHMINRGPLLRLYEGMSPLWAYDK